MVSTVSPVRYAPSGDAFVAYRVMGSGPPVVLINDWFSHQTELWTAESPFHDVLRDLAATFRLITFDKRGVGLSDPVASPFLPTLEDWSADVVAVLDAERIDRASLIGKGSGGAMAMMASASHPERFDKLVLINAWARLTQAPGYPLGVEPEAAALLVVEPYMPAESIRWLLARPDDRIEQWLGNYARAAAGPALTLRMRKWLLEVDVRSVLEVINVPTLVFAREHGWIGAAHARYLAEHIPRSTLAVAPGSADYLFAGDLDALLAAVVPFLGEPASPHATDRVLKSVVFTDIVDSTPKATAMGDSRWHKLLDHHDELVSEITPRWGGSVIKHTGDGVLLAFDGPARALHCAQQIRQALKALDIEIRCGVHTGEVERRGDDLAGLAVHIAARVIGAARAGQIAASRTVRDLVMGGGFDWVELGEYTLKGVPDSWNLYQLVSD